ncbi:MAG: hypothetical protein ACI4UV_16590 [Victivallales bacterium]
MNYPDAKHTGYREISSAAANISAQDRGRTESPARLFFCKTKQRGIKPIFLNERHFGRKLK